MRRGGTLWKWTACRASRMVYAMSYFEIYVVMLTYVP